jgi:NADPH-dependent ferric siderophore reductase
MTQTADAGTLPPAAAFELEVLAREVVTPLMTRLRLSAPELADFRSVPGQDLMLAIPRGDGETINRRYTIRRHDPASQAVDIDAVIHGHGPGAAWFAEAAAGDRIGAYGPRGKVVASPTADWHLFVADESGLPATAAMLEALEPTATAIAVVEVADAAEEQAIDLPTGATVTWVHRDGAEPGWPDLLVTAVAALRLPEQSGHAYLSAEMGVVNALRADLGARGFSSDEISPKSYWRRDQANAAHGEPMRDRT